MENPPEERIRRTRHTARKNAPRIHIEEEILDRPLTAREREARGGHTGPLTGYERGVLLYCDYYHLKRGHPKRYPKWFREKYPREPAYHYNKWEKSLLRGEECLVTLARYQRVIHRVCENEGFEAMERERIAFEHASKSILEEFQVELRQTRTLGVHAGSESERDDSE